MFRGSKDFSIRQFFLLKNQFTLSLLVRKEAFDEVGQYDESLSIWEDYELFLRIGRKYKLRNIKQPMTGILVHQKGVSRTGDKKHFDTEMLIIRQFKKDSFLLFRLIEDSHQEASFLGHPREFPSASAAALVA